MRTASGLVSGLTCGRRRLLHCRGFRPSTARAVTEEVSASVADGGGGRDVVTAAAVGWTAGSVDVLARGALSWNQQLSLISKQHYKCNA